VGHLSQDHGYLVAIASSGTPHTILRHLVFHACKWNGMKAVVCKEGRDPCKETRTGRLLRLEIVKDPVKQQASSPDPARMRQRGNGADLRKMGSIAVAGSASQKLSLRGLSNNKGVDVVLNLVQRAKQECPISR
jgi:hypothetical protein